MMIDVNEYILLTVFHIILVILVRRISSSIRTSLVIISLILMTCLFNDFIKFTLLAYFCEKLTGIPRPVLDQPNL